MYKKVKITMGNIPKKESKTYSKITMNKLEY